jgi:hypothetical protein
MANPGEMKYPWMSKKMKYVRIALVYRINDIQTCAGSGLAGVK